MHLILLTNYMYFTTCFPSRPFHNFPSLILSFHFANFLFWFFFLFHMRRINLQTQRLTVEHKKVCKESITRFSFRRGFAFDFALVNIALVAHGPATTERGNGGSASKYNIHMYNVEYVVRKKSIFSSPRWCIRASAESSNEIVDWMSERERIWNYYCD